MISLKMIKIFSKKKKKTKKWGGGDDLYYDALNTRTVTFSNYSKRKSIRFSIHGMVPHWPSSHVYSELFFLSLFSKTMQDMVSNERAVSHEPPLSISSAIIMVRNNSMYLGFTILSFFLCELTCLSGMK